MDSIKEMVCRYVKKPKVTLKDVIDMLFSAFLILVGVLFLIPMVGIIALAVLLVAGITTYEPTTWIELIIVGYVGGIIVIALSNYVLKIVDYVLEKLLKYIPKTVVFGTFCICMIWCFYVFGDCIYKSAIARGLIVEYVFTSVIIQYAAFCVLGGIAFAIMVGVSYCLCRIIEFILNGCDKVTLLTCPLAQKKMEESKV